jgi:hypothetical protein
MNQDTERSDLIVIGIVILGIGNGLFKWLQVLVAQVQQILQAFAKGAVSIAMMLWDLVIIVGITSLGLAAIASAVYVTYKYIRLVQSVTAVREGFADEVAQMWRDFKYMDQAFSQSLDGTRHAMNLKMDQMRAELNQKIEAIESAQKESKAESEAPQTNVIPEI